MNERRGVREGKVRKGRAFVGVHRREREREREK